MRRADGYSQETDTATVCEFTVETGWSEALGAPLAPHMTALDRAVPRVLTVGPPGDVKRTGHF